MFLCFEMFPKDTTLFQKILRCVLLILNYKYTILLLYIYIFDKLMPHIITITVDHFEIDENFSIWRYITHYLPLTMLTYRNDAIELIYGEFPSIANRVCCQWTSDNQRDTLAMLKVEGVILINTSILCISEKSND